MSLQRCRYRYDTYRIVLSGSGRRCYRLRPCHGLDSRSMDGIAVEGSLNASKRWDEGTKSTRFPYVCPIQPSTTIKCRPTSLGDSTQKQCAMRDGLIARQADPSPQWTTTLDVQVSCQCSRLVGFTLKTPLLHGCLCQRIKTGCNRRMFTVSCRKASTTGYSQRPSIRNRWALGHRQPGIGMISRVLVC